MILIHNVRKRSAPSRVSCGCATRSNLFVNWLHISCARMRCPRSNSCSSRGPLVRMERSSASHTPHVALQPTTAAVRRTTASMPSRQGEIVRNVAGASLADAPFLHEVPRIRPSASIARMWRCQHRYLWHRLSERVARFFFICCLLSRPARHDRSDEVRCGISSCRPFEVQVVIQTRRKSVRSECHSHTRVWFIQISKECVGPSSVGLTTCERLRGIHVKHELTKRVRKCG